MDDNVVKVLASLETKVEYIEKTITELKNDIRQPRMTSLPVAGGLVGILAAACTAYLQATGQA